jgi:hypothetical protein
MLLLGQYGLRPGRDTKPWKLKKLRPVIQSRLLAHLLSEKVPRPHHTLPGGILTYRKKQTMENRGSNQNENKRV